MLTCCKVGPGSIPKYRPTMDSSLSYGSEDMENVLFSMTSVADLDPYVFNLLDPDLSITKQK